MTAKQIQRVIDYQNWKEDGIRNGKHVSKATPNAMFWDAWKLDKEGIKAAGISCKKTSSGWFIYYWQNIHQVNSEKITPVPQSLKKLNNNSGLLKYQETHVAALIHALEMNGAALDGSDTGTGKTPSALGVVRELNSKFFILCPKTIIPVWYEWCVHIGVDPVEVINYEALKNDKHELMRIEKYKDKRGKAQHKIEWLIPHGSIMIFDEGHYCKGRDTINSKMMIAAKDQGYKIMILTATLADNPLQMQASGYALGLFPQINDFWRWIEAYGCHRNGWTKNGRAETKAEMMRSGFSFTSNKREQQEALERLHNAIYGAGRGSRMRIKDLGSAFPKNQVVAAAYYSDNAKKIQKVYTSLEREIRRLKALKEKSTNILTVLLRARQEIELLKAPTFVELARNAVAEGNSVAIFVNFQKTLDFIADELQTDCIICGGQKLKDRNRFIKAFQDDLSPYIVSNMRAGGVGTSLHDLHGNRPRVSLISPSFSAQDTKQALGRIYRAGAKSPAIQRIIFIANTVEHGVCETVKKKIGRIDTLNDGDFEPTWS